MNGFDYAMDLCAGYGRNTKDFLALYFDKIDINDQSTSLKLKDQWDCLKKELNSSRRLKGRLHCKIISSLS